MAEIRNLDKIESARLLLKASIEKSKEVASALDETSSKLQAMNRRLPSPTHKRVHETIGDQIDCLMGPIAAVLRVYGTVCELDTLLSNSDPRNDLFGHMSLTKRLEEVSRFLSCYCGLASKWLEEVLQLLGSDANDERLLSLKSSARILEQLREIEGRGRIKGGVLSVALDKLENEFSTILREEHIEVSAIQKLQIMIERFEANGRLENCYNLFKEVRVSHARRSLQALDLEYLDVKIDAGNIQRFELVVTQWAKHLELVVKHVFKQEFELCNQVFKNVGSDNSRRACFAWIAVESGILSFFRVGIEFTQVKKDPIKLLRLLDVFKALNNLRPEFSQLFGDLACSEIQIPTRNLIKRLVDCVCDIFWDLPAQVALQRRFASPSDGSVPRLVRFVTQYCNQLLGEDYRHALIEVLTIQKKWKQELYVESAFSNQFLNIMKEIGLNLDEWSKAYADVSLSYLFMMNNHCHFCNLKGTKLGDLMGHSWLSANEQYKEYYASLYLKESWGNILPYLTRKCMFSIARETSQDLDKKRLKAFNEAFEERYEKHSKWVISDEALRRNVCELLVQTVVPAYRSYIKSYRALVEQDASASKYVKHSVQSLETKLSSLFHPKLIKYCSNKHARLISRIKNVVTNKFSTTISTM